MWIGRRHGRVSPSLIYLDTHVVAWLYRDAAARLPPPVRQRIETEDALISPIVALELAYLHEIGRVNAPADLVLGYLADRMGLRFCDEPFDHVIRSAALQTWTRDPFDRIVVGHAGLRRRVLITKDAAIRTHYPHSFWQEA